MASVLDAKTESVGFGNERKLVRVEYDFANDGGATGALTLLTASGAMCVRLVSLFVETAYTSGGSMTMDIGTTATADVIAADIAVAALSILSVHTGTAASDTVPVYLADGQVIKQTIVAEAGTAGKGHYVFEIWKPQQ